MCVCGGGGLLAAQLGHVKFIAVFFNSLKVGSCPNNKNLHQILFGPFLCSI